MAENTESDNKVLEDLATAVDKLQSTLPNTKSIIIFEMNDWEFAKTKKIFSIFDSKIQRFKIDISGTEIVFLSDKLLSFEDEEPKPEDNIEEPNVDESQVPEMTKKDNWFRRLFFSRK